MPSRTGEFVDKAGKFLQERLHELDEERARVERALAELTGGRIGRKGAARPRAAAAAARRRPGGTRAAEAQRLVKANPGINASAIARKMGINPNYVYRVMASLEKSGKVKKKGRSYTAS